MLRILPPAALPALPAALIATVMLMAPLFVAPVRADDLIRNPPEAGAFFEAGRLVHGQMVGESRPGGKSDGQTLQLSGGWVSLSGTYKEDLDLRTSLGANYWYSLPEQSAAHQRLTHGGAGLGEAYGLYRFTPTLKLQFGLFQHKYNPDSKHLGEYLFRSGTYPGVIATGGVLTSGGMDLVNTSRFLAQGLRLSYSRWSGKLTHDLTLYSERTFEPNYDLSPGYTVAVKPHPAVEIGGGLVLSHFFSVEARKTMPGANENAYDKNTGLPLQGNDLFDTTLTQSGSLGHYTFAGVKVMGRASFDPKALIDMPFLGPLDLRLYAEIAVLGWKNYPFFYRKRTERMPIMIGFNLPTFKQLEEFAVEFQYYQSPFPQDIDKVRSSGYPIWAIPADSSGNSVILAKDYLASKTAKTLMDMEHSIRWAVFAKRSLGQHIGLYAMAASDFTRPVHFYGDPEQIPFTRDATQWYYVLRLETSF